MSNNSNISSNWAGFRRLWIIVALILFALLVILMLAGYGPWGTKCDVAPTVVEKETLVDNPELLTRIGLLQKENDQIAGLKTSVADLTKSQGLVVGLQAKVKELQAMNVAGNNDKATALNMRIGELEQENGLIAGLKAKVSALEAIDVNFIKPKDDSALVARIAGLEKENGLIAGLKAKVSALEAIDVNFIKPKDDSALLKSIEDLKAQNGMIPGLKAKIKALEAIDINFITNSSANTGSTMMSVPNAAKLYFEPGSSRYPVDAKQSMADVIVYLRANSSSKVSLVGFHDETGNANWNRRLANKRSNSVKQILLDAGISDSRITVEKPSQTLGTGSPAEARRVEVNVSK